MTPEVLAAPIAEIRLGRAQYGHTMCPYSTSLQLAQ
jgi:hypothetical protein